MKSPPPSRIRAIDSHVHFWDPRVHAYPWLETVPGLNRTFLPDDYTAVTAGRVASVIFVEANCAPGQALKEIAYVQRLRSQFPWIAGIVAFADLLDDTTRRHRIAACAKLDEVVGIRYNIQGHPRGFCLQSPFVDGVREVGANGLVFDLCVTFDQLDDVAELVQRCPHTRFVLDHCGKPRIASGAAGSWARSLAGIAEAANVSCKISGLLTEASDDQRTRDVIEPYISHVRDCFGATRLMYGSDWPVVTMAGGESAWRQMTDLCTAAWPEHERHAFYVDNATRIYNLAQPNA